ncbi:putative RTA-like protein [Septoria linicola]|nr:putative RTA-like protein [Septoria linicola]
MTPSYRLVPRLDPNQGCTKDTCDASQSIYGYTPNLAATVIFLIIFALSGVLYIFQGIKTRTWFFSSVMFVGCLSMSLGYAGKLILNNDPFSDPGFKLTVVLFTFSPAFYAAGIYYTLKHICLTFGSSFSRLRPQWYTSIFISCDFLSIVLQAVGGGIASASEDETMLRVGDRIMTTGLALQVATMLVFAALAADYAFAVRRNKHQLNTETSVLRNSKQFKLFIAALCVSYTCILIRCAYRLAELSKGWGPQNDILRDQGLFIGLDSVPCAIATIVLNIWHPGWCFPKNEQEVIVKAVSSDSSSDDEKMEV